MSDLSVRAGATLDLSRWTGAVNFRVIALTVALLAAGAAALGEAYGWRQAVLLLLGGGLGVTLYHALFGFTSAWRVFIADGRGAGLRAQMLMLAVASILFFPVLAQGSLFGLKLNSAVEPVGLSVIVGAFLFGLGMQLGGGCASGTLYTVGGGSTRMLVTLFFFVVGSVIGAYQLPWWEHQWNVGRVSLIRELGWAPALALSLAVFAAIAAISAAVERRRHGRLLPGTSGDTQGIARLLRGPWPLLWGAVLLALGNFATLAIAGRPWGITSAFALWGAKTLAAAGVDVEFWDYWAPAARAQQLGDSIFADVTSVMDAGIILGAALAAGLAGKFAPLWRIPLRSLAAAAVGGLLLGYGARLAYGCNIGAYFSGIASASVHGWLWLAAAFAGNAIGVHARPFFGLEVERAPRQTGC